MTPFLTSLTLLLLLSTTALISASIDFGTQRLPNGGALFSLSSRHLTPRQGLADCGGDPDCTPQTWGCQCGFADDSWLNAPSDPSVPDSSPPAVSTTAPPPPPSSPAPAPAPSPSATTDPASVTCTVNGLGCDCSDGTHPEQDEDGRCCIWDHGGTYISVSLLCSFEIREIFLKHRKGGLLSYT